MLKSNAIDKKKNRIVNGYVELLKEKLSFTFDDGNTAIYYDDMTTNFIFCVVKLNRTFLSAKTSNDTNIWTVEIPGNASIISIKICPSNNIVAIQRSSYYLEFVVVTLKNQNQKLMFQSCCSKKSTIINFFWIDSTHVIYITSVGIELYEISCELTLKLLDKTSFVSEWQYLYYNTNQLSMLIAGKDFTMNMYYFKDNCSRVELYQTIQLDIPTSVVQTDEMNHLSLTHSTKIPNDNTKSTSITSKNVKLFVIYNKLLLFLYGIHAKLVYVFKLIDVPHWSSINHIPKLSPMAANAKKSNYPTKLLCTFVLRYTLDNNEDCNQPNILLHDDLIYLIFGPRKHIYFYDISILKSCSLSTESNMITNLHNKHLIVYPIDLFISQDYDQLISDFSETIIDSYKFIPVDLIDGYSFMDNDHLLFLEPNHILNTSNGTLWSIRFNFGYIPTFGCELLYQYFIVQLLQRRTEGHKHIFELIHQALVVKDCSFESARKLLDLIVNYNLVVSNHKSYNQNSDMLLLDPIITNKSELMSNNHLSHRATSFTDNIDLSKYFNTILSPIDYVKSHICQEDIFALVFLPLMAGDVNSDSRQNSKKMFNLETILLHFISMLCHHKIVVEIFLYEALIELMVKSNRIFQFQQLYQCGLIPKRWEIGEYIINYCSQHPSLIIISMDILIYSKPIKFIQLLLDNHIITEAVNKYNTIIRNKFQSNISYSNTKIIQTIITSLQSNKNISDSVYFSIFNWLECNLPNFHIQNIPSDILAQFKLRFGKFYK